MKKFLFSKSFGVILVIIVGLLVYYPSLYGKFMWDDEQQIVNHIYIRSIKNIPLFFKGSTFYQNQEHLIGVFYRPLMTTAYSLIYPFTNGKPFSYHLIQLLLHIMSAVILLHIFLQLFKHIKPSLKHYFIVSIFAVLIFLVHPMNSEVVSYIANMQDTLFFFFGVSALLVVLLTRKTILAILISGLLLALSIISKETGILFFPLILGYMYLFRKDKLLQYGLAYFLIFSAYMITRCWVAHMCQGHNGPNPIAKLPFLGYLMQLPAIVFYYIKTFFFPKNVALGQHWWVRTLNLNDFFIPLIALLLVFCTIILIWLFLNYKATTEKKYKDTALVYTFFSFWFVLGLLMHMHIMPLDFTVADRWFYFSMPGLLGILGSCFLIFSKKISTLTYAVSILIIISLASFTWQRNSYFQDPFKLYQHDNQITHGSFDLENNIGVEFYRRRQYKNARYHFKRSVEIINVWPISLVNLGVTYEREYKYQDAENYYRQTIKNGTYYPAYMGYVRVLIKQQKKTDAEKFLTAEALIKFPHDQVLINYLNQVKQLNNNL